MTYVSTREEIRAMRLDRQQVADLLSRYPQVSDDEAGQILTFIRTGRHLDVGMLTSDDRLRPRLDAFMEDHKSHFRVHWREGAAVIGVITAVLVTLGLLWEALA